MADKSTRDQELEQALAAAEAEPGVEEAVELYEAAMAYYLPAQMRYSTVAATISTSSVEPTRA